MAFSTHKQSSQQLSSPSLHLSPFGQTLLRMWDLEYVIVQSWKFTVSVSTGSRPIPDSWVIYGENWYKSQCNYVNASLPYRVCHPGVVKKDQRIAKYASEKVWPRKTPLCCLPGRLSSVTVKVYYLFTSAVFCLVFLIKIHSK